MVKDSPEAAEFSRPVLADQVGGQEIVREVEAGPAERAALAERLDLVALDRLNATVRLRRLPDGLIRLSGRLAADVVQSCVVTLAPVPAHCEEEFTVLFGEQPAEASLQAVEIDVLGADEPEPIVDGRIDLGEAVVQQLAVALDPYPRAPGAELPAQYSGEEANGSHGDAVTPFAALERLRKKD